MLKPILGMTMLAAAMHPTWELGALSGFSNADTAIAVSAMQYANQSVYSQCFEDKVKAAKFTENNNKSNEEILALVRKGYKPDLVLYRGKLPWSKVVAYVSKVDGPINLNRKFWVTGQEKARANTIVHEYMHKLGFSHQFKPWDHTVPYLVGQIVEDCIQ